MTVDVELARMRKWFAGGAHWAGYLSLLDGLERFQNAERHKGDNREWYRAWAVRSLNRAAVYLEAVALRGYDPPAGLHPEELMRSVAVVREKLSRLPRGRRWEPWRRRDLPAFTLNHGG